MTTNMPRAPRGIAVVFSLLIISLVTLIGIGITLIITRELKLSSNIDHAVSSYYAAEGGVEKGLYRVKDGKLNSHQLSTVLTAVKAYASTFTSNSSAFTDEASELTGSTEQDLAENQTVQIDYSATNPSICGTAACVDSWVIEWTGGAAATIEVSVISWAPGAQINLDSEVTKSLYQLPTYTSPITINNLLSTLHPTPNRFYRMRVKALGGDLAGLRVTAYDREDPLVNNGIIVPSATVITIKSVGKRGDFSQAVTAVVPWQLQLSGVFDYVLFSEDEIIKNVAVITNPPIYKTGRKEIEANLGSPPNPLVYCECGDPSGNGPGDVCPRNFPNRWNGICDTGGAFNNINVTKCNEASPAEAAGTCSVDSAALGVGATNYPGFYLPSTGIGVPSGQYYLRIAGVHFGTNTSVYLDTDQVGTPGGSPTVETFPVPAAVGGGACKFNCLFSTPIRVGNLCNGGTNNGETCSSHSDCPGVVNGCTTYSRFYLLGANGAGGQRTYFDWYSLSSSALLTGPTDKYCNQLGANECLP